MQNIYWLLLALITAILLFVACQKKQPTEPEADPKTEVNQAQKIVDAAIAYHGGSKYDSLELSFVFRKKRYSAKRQNGAFEYSRQFEDSTGQILDVLTNDGFTRYLNGEKQELTEKKSGAYSRSVNSVIYFTLLPYFLNDPAVNKKYLRTETIGEKTYHVLEISFEEEGGGKDHEDIYTYWFDTKTNSLDYLAYSYHTDEAGFRFRRAMNPRTVRGIRFQDYENYKPLENDPTHVSQMAQMHADGQLKLLSKIENTDIQVR